MELLLLQGGEPLLLLCDVAGCAGAAVDQGGHVAGVVGGNRDDGVDLVGVLGLAEQRVAGEVEGLRARVADDHGEDAVVVRPGDDVGLLHGGDDLVTADWLLSVENFTGDYCRGTGFNGFGLCHDDAEGRGRRRAAAEDELVVGGRVVEPEVARGHHAEDHVRGEAGDDGEGTDVGSAVDEDADEEDAEDGDLAAAGRPDVGEGGTKAAADGALPDGAEEEAFADAVGAGAGVVQGVGMEVRAEGDVYVGAFRRARECIYIGRL